MKRAWGSGGAGTDTCAIRQVTARIQDLATSLLSTGEAPDAGSIGRNEGMKRLLLAVLIVASMGLTCCKPKMTEWVPIGKNPSVALYIEKNSIRRVSTNTMRAWFTYVFTEPKAAGSKFIEKGLSYDEIDCSKRTLQIVQVTFFFSDGTSQSLTEKMPSTDIKADSMSAIEYSYLCQGMKEKRG
jgi:hypothetical protein